MLAWTDGLLPNPFAGYNGSDTGLQGQEFIYIVDGSEYGQVRRYTFLSMYVQSNDLKRLSVPVVNPT